MIPQLGGYCLYMSILSIGPLYFRFRIIQGEKLKSCPYLFHSWEE